MISLEFIESSQHTMISSEDYQISESDDGRM